jgi:hypothetical protein
MDAEKGERGFPRFLDKLLKQVNVRRSGALSERYGATAKPTVQCRSDPCTTLPLCYISLAMMTSHGVTMVNRHSGSVWFVKTSGTE